MSGGCGNAHFYANTTGTYSYDANTPDPMVLSSCEHYGLHDGTDGKDMTTPYTNKMTDDSRAGAAGRPVHRRLALLLDRRRLRRPRHLVPVPELPELRHDGEERRRHAHAQLVGVFVLLGDVSVHAWSLTHYDRSAWLGSVLRCCCSRCGACSNAARHAPRGRHGMRRRPTRRPRAGGFRVLLFSRTTGFRHDSIPTADRRPDRARARRAATSPRRPRIRPRSPPRTSRASASSCS